MYKVIDNTCGFFFFDYIYIKTKNNMKKTIRLTENDLMRLVKRVIKENKEGLEREARIILSRLGYRMVGLKEDTPKELARKLRQENKDRFSNHEEWEKLADKLED